MKTPVQPTNSRTYDQSRKRTPPNSQGTCFARCGRSWEQDLNAISLAGDFTPEHVGPWRDAARHYVGCRKRGAWFVTLLGYVHKPKERHDEDHDPRRRVYRSDQLLLMAFELRQRWWKLGFTTGVGQRGAAADRRRRNRVVEDIAGAKERLAVGRAPVISARSRSGWLLAAPYLTARRHRLRGLNRSTRPRRNGGRRARREARARAGARGDEERASPPTNAQTARTTKAARHHGQRDAADSEQAASARKKNLPRTREQAHEAQAKHEEQAAETARARPQQRRQRPGASERPRREGETEGSSRRSGSATKQQAGDAHARQAHTAQANGARNQQALRRQRAATRSSSATRAQTTHER